MRRLSYILFFFLTIQFGLQAQDFVVSIDTLHIDLKKVMGTMKKANLTHAVKYHDKYYCFFNESSQYSNGQSTRHFLMISSDGKTLTDIEMPQEVWNTTYFDFFIRNDSIFAKTYMNHDSFYFDVETLEWKKIKELDDKVYEDDNFIIKCLHFAELGASTWFIDKKTKKEYVLGIYGTTVNVLNGKYYFSDAVEIRVIENPLNLKQCDESYYYETAKNEDTFYEGSDSFIGSNVIYQYNTSDYGEWENPKKRILTSFVANNQLYHLCADSNTTYIAQIKNNEIIPLQDIGRKYSITNWYDSYNGKNLDNNSRFLKFSEDANTFGFIEINKNKIDINYFQGNIDSLNYLGTDGFERLFAGIMLNSDGLSLKQADSIEVSIGGTDSENSKYGISHNKYYPEIYKSMKVQTKEFIKIQDKKVMQKTEYLYLMSDKTVQSIFIEWSLTQPYTDNSLLYVSVCGQPDTAVEVFKNKSNEIEEIITRLVGKAPKKQVGHNGDIKLTWTSKNGLVITLYASDTFTNRKEIRLSIDKIQ